MHYPSPEVSWLIREGLMMVESARCRSDRRGPSGSRLHRQLAPRPLLGRRTCAIPTAAERRLWRRPVRPRAGPGCSVDPVVDMRPGQGIGQGSPLAVPPAPVDEVVVSLGGRPDEQDGRTESPEGSLSELPVARTALAHGTVEKQEQDGRSAKRIVAASPLALSGTCPRGLLVVAALADMKRSVSEPADDNVKVPPGTAARMRRSPGGRSRVLYVRLTEEEDREVRDRAAKAGLSGPRFLVETALSGSAESAASHRHAAVEARATRVVLKGVANNLNQIAKWANANHVLPDHFDDLLDDLDRAVVAVEQAAGTPAPLPTGRCR